MLMTSEHHYKDVCCLTKKKHYWKLLKLNDMHITAEPYINQHTFCGVHYTPLAIKEVKYKPIHLLWSTLIHDW